MKKTPIRVMSATLALSIVLGSGMPIPAWAREENSPAPVSMTERVEAVAESPWEAKDFTYEVLSKDTGALKKGEVVAASLSEEGLAKLKKNPHLVLPAKDLDGNPVRGLKQKFMSSDHRVLSVVFPEGYRDTGDFVFMQNQLQKVVFPETLERIGSAAFFDNQIEGELIIPRNVLEIPSAAFRRNKITNIVVKGPLEVIGGLSFSENKLTQIKLPTTVKKIGKEAFKTNPGLRAQEGKVVLVSQDGKPFSFEGAENFVTSQKEIEEIPDPFTEWTTDHFKYQGTTVTGFSDLGKEAIKNHKDLVIPEKTPEGEPITTIGIDAFRNLMVGYDIESVVIPDSVKEIKNYAFQFNDIKKVRLPKALEKLGWGVFSMNEELSSIEWNDSLKLIDQIAFYGTHLSEITIPASVEKIGTAAFRDVGLTHLEFEEGSSLREIDKLAFADNQLTEVNLPESLEIIGIQAFIKNELREVTVGKNLKEIGLGAFAENPGVEEYHNQVVIHAPKEVAEQIPDDSGHTFVVNPKDKAEEKDKKALQEALTAALAIDPNSLEESFQKVLSESIKEAQETLENSEARRGAVLRVTFDLRFLTERATLSQAIHRLENAETWKKLSAEDQKIAENLMDDARQKVRAINAKKDKLAQLTGDLNFLADLPGKEGLTVHYGEAQVGKTHYINPPYTVKVKIWTKGDQILRVMDNGTFDDFVPKDEHDENHHEGWWKDAMRVLPKYVGRSLSAVKGEKDVDVIASVTKTTEAFGRAIQHSKPAPSEKPTPGNPVPPAPAPLPRPTPGPIVPLPVPGPVIPAPENPSPVKPSPEKPNPEKPAPVSTSLVQLAGKNRYETAVKISQASYDKAETVILCGGENFADALAASGLAAAMKAPLLLTPAKELPQEVGEEINRLQAKEILVVGGERSVAQEVAQKPGLSVERLSGKDRYETAEQVAERVLSITKTKVGYLASGENYPDALAAGAQAGREGAFVLLTRREGLTSKSRDLLFQMEKVIVVGGERSVSSKALEGLSVERIAGENRYETALLLAKRNSVKTPILASGEVFADALAAGALAAQKEGAILLVKKNDATILSNYLSEKEFKELILVGGEHTLGNLKEKLR